MPLSPQEQDELELLQLEEEEHQYQTAQATSQPSLAPAPPAFNEFESAGLGALQGATLGFADELEGGFRGGIEALTNDESSLVQAYRKHRDNARTRNAEAQKANPLSYTGGEVVGGLATLVTPLGAANATARGAVIAGTAAGGASGLGSSNTDLTTLDPAQLKEAAIDTGISAGAGGILGGVGYGITKAIPEVAEGVKNQFRAGQRASKEGRTILGEKAGERINKEIVEASKLVTETGEKLQDKLGKQVGSSRKALTAADEKGYTGFLDNQLKKIDDFVASKQGATIDEFPELKKMRDHLDRLRYGKEITSEVPYTEIKQVAGKPSTVKKLQDEAAKLTEQSKLSGENAMYDVIETVGSDKKPYASLIKRTSSISNEAPEKMVPVRNVDGQPIFDESSIAPVEEMVYTGAPSINEGIKVKTAPSLPEILPTEQFVEGTKKVSTRLKPNLTPSGEDIASTVTDLRGLTEDVLNKESLASAKDIAAGIRKEAGGYMEGLSPEIAESNRQYKALMDLDRTFGNVVGSGDKALVGASKEGDYLKDTKQLRNFLEGLKGETKTGRRSSELLGEELEPKVRSYVELLKNNASKTKTPEEALEFNKAAENFEQFLTRGKNAAEDFAARQEMKSTGLMGIPSLLLKYGAYGAGKSSTARGGLKATEKLLEASPQITPGVLTPEEAPPKQPEPNKADESKPAKISQNLYNMSDDELLASTDQIESVRPEVAQRLRDAVEANDQHKKKAMQFVIAQDPKLRKLFNA